VGGEKLRYSYLLLLGISLVVLLSVLYYSFSSTTPAVKYSLLWERKYDLPVTGVAISPSGKYATDKVKTY